jgi:hypothetical protein
MILTGADGKECMLVACEQRTAIAWLEAMDLMLANVGRRGESVRVRTTFPKGEFWLILSMSNSSPRFMFTYPTSFFEFDNFRDKEWNPESGARTISAERSSMKLKAST